MTQPAKLGEMTELGFEHPDFFIPMDDKAKEEVERFLRSAMGQGMALAELTCNLLSGSRLPDSALLKLAQTQLDVIEVVLIGLPQGHRLRPMVQKLFEDAQEKLGPAIQCATARCIARGLQ